MNKSVLMCLLIIFMLIASAAYIYISYLRALERLESIQHSISLVISSYTLELSDNLLVLVDKLEKLRESNMSLREFKITYMEDYVVLQERTHYALRLTDIIGKLCKTYTYSEETANPRYTDTSIIYKLELILHDLYQGLVSYDDVKVYQYANKTDVLAEIAEQLRGSVK